MKGPNTYLALVAGTTLIHRAAGEGIGGPQGDLNEAFGVGRFVTKSIALELDVGGSFTRGTAAGVSLVAGVVWVFKNGIAPIHELNAVSVLARGGPDLGGSATRQSLFILNTTQTTKSRNTNFGQPTEVTSCRT